MLNRTRGTSKVWFLSQLLKSLSSNLPIIAEAIRRKANAEDCRKVLLQLLRIHGGMAWTSTVSVIWEEACGVRTIRKEGFRFRGSFSMRGVRVGGVETQYWVFGVLGSYAHCLNSPFWTSLAFSAGGLMTFWGFLCLVLPSEAVSRNCLLSAAPLAHHARLIPRKDFSV